MGKVFNWGRADVNDFKHFAAGIAIVFFVWGLILILGLEKPLALEGEWVGLMACASIAAVWEYGQKLISKAYFDVKDWLITFAGGVVAAIIINILL